MRNDSDAEMTAGTEKIMPYRAWWGLAASGLIMGIIMAMAPYATFEILPRASAFDYPWKLSDPTAYTRAVVWSLYALHQIGIWYLIYKAQSMKLKYVRHTYKCPRYAFDSDDLECTCGLEDLLLVVFMSLDKIEQTT